MYSKAVSFLNAIEAIGNEGAWMTSCQRAACQSNKAGEEENHNGTEDYKDFFFNMTHTHTQCSPNKVMFYIIENTTI